MATKWRRPLTPQYRNLRIKNMMASRAIILSLFLLLSLSHLSHAAKSSRLWTSFPALHRAQRLPESSNQQAGGLYETRYFTQTLDHFNYLPESSSTFQQRYLVNDTHWGGKGAPIFVYTGNEGDIEWFAQNTGFMFENAPRFKALLVFIEHRFYGKSIPPIAYALFANASNLGWLSSTQALADYATLIVDLKKNLSADSSPVVVFGGSYGGMLAAWFRLKYPHVAIGALSSSAPILQFDGIVSPYSFNNIITKDFRSESESCYKTIKGSWKVIEDIENQPGGFGKLDKIFKTCTDSAAEYYGIEGWIQTALIYAAMTDYPTPSNFLIPLPANPVKQMCEAIDNPATGNDTLAKMFAAMNIYYNYTGNSTCFELYSSDTHGMANWDWQACTEMVLPTDGNTMESIFPYSPYNYSDRTGYCQQAYGVTPRPHWITTEFGGHDIKRVLKRFASNIIFFNGLRDPWSGGGVLKSLSKSLIAIVAPQGAHHVDLRYSTTEDPKWLTNIRRKEIMIIEGRLKQYYKDSEMH